MWYLPPWFRKGTTNRSGPSHLPFLWSSSRTFVPSRWVSKLWSHLCESQYCPRAFKILFQVHLKAWLYEMYWEITKPVGDTSFGASPPMLPLRLLHTKGSKNGFPAPRMKLQWPLMGFHVMCAQMTRPPLGIKWNNHFGNEECQGLEFSFTNHDLIPTRWLLWDGAAIEFAHLRWAYCCMWRTDFLSQKCNPQGLPKLLRLLPLEKKAVALGSNTLPSDTVKKRKSKSWDLFM